MSALKNNEPSNFRCKCGRIAFCLEDGTNEPICKELWMLRCGKIKAWEYDNKGRRHEYGE